MRRVTGAVLACCGCLLPPIVKSPAGGGSFGEAAAFTSVRPAPAGAAVTLESATLEVDVDGAMAPVAARIRLRCEDAAGQPMAHMLGLGPAGYDLVSESPISVSRAFERTTEIRALCRDARGGSHPLAPRVIVAIDAAGQADSIRVLGDAARRRSGAGPLRPDAELDSLATAHARDMAERGYFGHVTPEGRGLEGRLKDGSVAYAAAGENIAGNETAAGAVRAWLDSPGHRQNLMNPAFERIGVGVYRTPSSPYTYYVQIFAK